MSEDYCEIDFKKRKFEREEKLPTEDFVARNQNYINYGNVVSISKEENIGLGSTQEHADDQTSSRDFCTIFTPPFEAKLQQISTDLSRSEADSVTNTIPNSQLMRTIATSGDFIISQKWSKEEHESFLRGMRMHGKNWDQVATQVPSKTKVHIAEYAEQFFIKKSRMTVMGGGNVLKRQRLIEDQAVQSEQLNATTMDEKCMDVTPIGLYSDESSCGGALSTSEFLNNMPHVAEDVTLAPAVCNARTDEVIVKAETRNVDKPSTTVWSAPPSDSVLRCPYTLASVVRMIHSPLFATLLVEYPELGDLLIHAAPDQQVIVERLPDAVVAPRLPLTVKATSAASPLELLSSSYPPPSATRQYFYSGVFPIPETGTLAPIPSPMAPLSVPEVVKSSALTNNASSAINSNKIFPVVRNVVSDERQAAEILAAQMLSGLAAPFRVEASAASSSIHMPHLQDSTTHHQIQTEDCSQEQQADIPAPIAQCASVEVHHNSSNSNDDDVEDDQEEKDTSADNAHLDRAEDGSKAPNRNSKKYRHLKLYDKYEIVQKLRYYEMEARNAKSVCNMHNAVAREYDVCESTIYQIVKKQLAIEAKYYAQQLELESGTKKKGRSRKKKCETSAGDDSFSSSTAAQQQQQQQTSQQQTQDAPFVPTASIPYFIGNSADIAPSHDPFVVSTPPNASQLQAAITAVFGSGFMVTQTITAPIVSTMGTEQALQ